MAAGSVDTPRANSGADRLDGDGRDCNDCSTFGGCGIDSPDAVQLHDVNVAGYSAELAPKVAALKAFLYQNMYQHYRLVRMHVKAEQFVADILTPMSKNR